MLTFQSCPHKLPPLQKRLSPVSIEKCWTTIFSQFSPIIYHQKSSSCSHDYPGWSFSLIFFKSNTSPSSNDLPLFSIGNSLTSISSSSLCLSWTSTLCALKIDLTVDSFTYVPSFLEKCLTAAGTPYIWAYLPIASLSSELYLPANMIQARQ